MRWGVLLASAAVFAAPVQAQDADVAPAPVSTPAPALAPAPAADSNVAPFYAARPGNLIWLRSPENRAAVLAWVDRFAAELGGWRDAIAAGDVDKMSALIAAARAGRERILGR